MNKILSFDVGIKNLAYCIINNEKNICDWNVINIINEDQPCCGINKNNSLCKSKASFQDKNLNSYYCKKHSNSNCSKIVNKKIKSTSIGEISELLFNKLDEYPVMLEVDIVLIENQPCLMNPMIKSVQMLLFSYFVIKGKLIQNNPINTIKFISAKNKLSIYDGPELPVYSKNKYTQRKKEGIEVCKYLLDGSTNLEFLKSHSKKDDLADSYLQAIWYIEKNKL